ncbi:MAG: hypothetical protein Q9219_001853 [cf. Caloplaca sp. 3 TL-2023]
MADPNKEERLMTLYSDVHYYFSAPTPRPLSHRFDKGSYLYLYRNKNGPGARLEIANNVGKPEQDAVTGGMPDLPLWLKPMSNIMTNAVLDSVTVRQSHKHPTLCTVTVDGNVSHPATADTPTQHPEHYWRLPNTDPRNEGKYLFRLHTLDIYFWTVTDAQQFMDALERMLRPQQLEILDRPSAPAAHEHLMSPVVQKLENVAIEDTAYQDGKTRNSRSAAAAFSPPPTLASGDTQAKTKPDDPGSYKPLAYNPAAPPAPEPIRHREKTPPPPDAEHEGTGLSAAAYNDHAHAVSPLSHPAHGSLSQPPYPSTSHTSAYSSPQPYGNPYASPPPFAALTGISPVPNGRAGSMSSLPPPPPQGTRNPSVPAAQPPYGIPSTQAHSPPSTAPQQAMFSPPPRDTNPMYPGGNKPLDSPSAQILGNSYVAHSPQPLQHLQPQYADYLASRPQQPPQGAPHEPVGGYSDYNYSQPQHHHHHHHHHAQEPGAGYDVHNQVYRPTEEEAHRHKQQHRPSESGQSPGRLEQSAGRIDKGVNRFFKKLEKRIG